MNELLEKVLAFRDARDWAQFHGLRHLIVSLNLEAGELLELTQWKNDAEIEALPRHPASREALADECADVLMYLLLLAHAGGIDLHAAVLSKLDKNAAKYPVEQCFGSREKYTALQQAASKQGE